MRSLIIRLLLHLFLRESREITKTTPEHQYDLYKFGNPNDVLELLKVIRTQQTIWYFEAMTDLDRSLARGAANILTIMIEANREVMRIEGLAENDEKKLTLWKLFRSNKRIN